MYTQAADALGVAQKDVIHSVNYTQNSTRSFEIDRLTYKILDMALRNAKDFCSVSQPLRSMQNLERGEWTSHDAGFDISWLRQLWIRLQRLFQVL